MPHPVEDYLKSMHILHASGGTRKETSFYPPLANLLDTVGKELTPRVFCVSQVKDTGSGSPDFGLYTVTQQQRGQETELLRDVLPERGVVEVKGTDDDTWLIATGEQVTRYWGKYGQVLVTNYRDFLLVGRNEHGEWATLESFRLAENASDFWERCANPRSTVRKLGDRLVEYIKRVLLSVTTLTEPESVAWLLASYARDAKARIDAQGELPGLRSLQDSMEAALGVKFSDANATNETNVSRAKSTEEMRLSRGERFFRTTLVQTLFYGVFSSWILWARGNGNNRKTLFNWHDAAWNLHVPMIADLFSRLAQPGQLQPLGLEEVMDWTGAVLNRIDRDTFFKKFDEEHAVQYFYEPFLQAYDPELRKDLGVWYTPPEIVKYQVERVDTVLREELGIADGLANANVFVLDPCCGTGAYLVETLRKIRETLDENGAGATAAARLKEAAQQRIFGFEILPAPFVIAHLQLGLLLRQAGAPLDDRSKERVGVYLTNALTGWEPAKAPKTKIPPEWEAERAASDKVKQDKPILVVIGNPPYNAFAGVSPKEEAGLVEAYKEGLISHWKIKKFNLDDLYVRFFRVAERRVVKSGKGVVSFIANFSYISEPSFVAMRQLLCEEFNKIWIDCMNGDSRETGKLTPEGEPDPSVFSHAHNREGIRVGTAVCVMVRHETGVQTTDVRFRHFWGNAKREALLASLKSKHFDQQYDEVTPTADTRYSFRPSEISETYRSWHSLTELCAVPPMNGLMEKRGGALIDIDREALEERLKAYLDRELDWDAYRKKHDTLTKPYAGFNPATAHDKAHTYEKFSPAQVVRYMVRPFDVRWAYYSAVSPIWNRSRPNLWAQYWEGNLFLVSRPAGVASPEGIPIGMVSQLGDNDAFRGHAYYFPLRLKQQALQKHTKAGEIFSAHTSDVWVANLSTKSREYLASIGVSNPDADTETAGLIWYHALAIGCSPAYLTENTDGIKIDWLRVPLPKTQEQLRVSAKLGRTVAALMDLDVPVASVTSGKIDPSLRLIGVLHKTSDQQIDPNSDDLRMSAGWGHFGKDNVVMPARGSIKERSLNDAERQAMGSAAAVLCPSGNTFDVFLNGTVCWKNIPSVVWDSTIGGYQVLKKWLSYREHAILKRKLTLEEVAEVTTTARRLTALYMLRNELDENYHDSCTTPAS